ncbi:hypothetical protein [Micromonospora sp. C28ISP2-4]|uniref:hypothetical protein n=1 Tax=Micromonospora sp. C28ISP2-4 TaxID=3059523 RepID=UPI002674D452|nr:hypothetical protein [Micromonospora sp. C28ISP2-4]MDO3685996.1 hypothetical protein [Micromonospora sp. C28ISP2-4]
MLDLVNGRHEAATTALALLDQGASSTASPSRRALSARGSADAERGFRTLCTAMVCPQEGAPHASSR